MEVPKAARNCCLSGRELLSGEIFFSILVEEDDVYVRRDFASENWQGPPEKFVGWWKTKVQNINDKKAKLAPNEVMLNLFEQIRTNSGQADLLYVLSLLLIRRRLFKYDREEQDENGQKKIVVYAIKENNSFEIPVAMPDLSRLEEIQNQLAELLYD
ncbi:MAG: hypothetical protein LBK06_06825 [Planctomycetaceae bacterium]|jgi:hypothetical protein|nr:hypothetical protein [Planctomycetaceae bacterium]